MLKESITALNIKTTGTYIDATFGRGGHTQAILEKLGERGKMIAFDQDLDAIKYAHKNFNDPRLKVIHSAFSNVETKLKERQLSGKIDGILLDLGVSSPQLDCPSRGFSFNTEGKLDMRMNQTVGKSAAQWLASASEAEIADIIYRFGEERKSRHIARAIKQYQQTNPLETTTELARIVSDVVKSGKHKHPATRTFQAIRIFINQELSQLSAILRQTINLLAPEGRLCVISFHSIEDRLVKRFITQNSKPESPPKGLPVIEQNPSLMALENLGKTFPSADELQNNRRARSAILRVAERSHKLEKC